MGDERKVTAGGREIQVRGLKRKEVKWLRTEHGINLSGLRVSQADEAADKVFEIILAPEDIEYLNEQCNSESVRVFNEIMKATYGSGEEAKNY
ncbi:MAG: hypothetical protein K9J79_03835 [Desulfobacteraceae bacterium]|nr:hypothetical protein [Desulfobacteraceae bacterium]